MGSSKQTTKSNSQTAMGPWQPSQASLEGILGQAQGLAGNTGINATENQALSGLAQNAQTSQGYAPQLQGLTDSLFAGGGYGAGVPGINQAWQTAQGALNPIASGSLDPMQNPATAGLISSITDQVNNDVGGQFAAAGRSFSGAHAGALGKNLTNALAPTLFNQYNQNVSNAMGASNSLMQGAQGTSGALDQSAGNQLNAQMQAPGSLANMNLPQLQALAAEAARRGLPISNLSDLSNLILPIAQTGQQGTQSGTSTTTQKNSLGQTIAGAALGGLGILGQGGAFGTGGMFGGAFNALLPRNQGGTPN